MRVSSFIDNSIHGEDAILLDERLFVVFDGVSTAQGRVAAQTLKKSLLGAGSKKKVRKVLRLVSKELTDALTTVAGVLLFKKNAWVFSVGDSPVIWTKNYARVLHLDSGDKPEIITQAIGDDAFYLHEKIIKREETLLLMSDGISDNISIEELKACSSESTETFCKNIKDLLVEKKKKNEGFVYDFFKEDDQALIVLHLNP